MRGLTCLLSAVLLCSPAVLAQVKVGEEIHLTLETQHPYGFAERDEAELVWSETFHHPQASYIAPHFARFELAEGDWVVVRSPDGTQSWRYEGLGRAGLGLSPGGFWSTHIKGTTAVVELYSKTAVGRFGFVIDRYARGYTSTEIAEVNPELNPDRDPELPEPEAICGSDDSEWARCYTDTEPEIYERSRAVVRLLMNGSSACTGWLVGCEGHVMTNQHCIGSASTAANTDFEFMAEGATCGTSCSSWGACPGIIEADTSTLIQLDSALDYALVQLPTNLSETYGFMQLRETGPVVNERIYIPQHPAHWGKRIAVFSSHSSDESGFAEVFSLNQPPCTGGPGDVGYHADTQGGSSGSPVLAYSDHRVVSLHHCANCPNRGTNMVDVVADLGDNLPACAVDQLAGTIGLDRNVFSCADALTITVVDDSLQGARTQTVALWSDTETVPEIATLSETESGTFVGTFATQAGPGFADDDHLSVAHGDSVTVEYVDADDGVGGVDVPLQATAQVDCEPPVISGVAATEVTGNGATVVWATDEPANSLVVVGGGASTAAEDDLVAAHSVRVIGLAECSTHYYSVTSTDEAGNSTTDDATGTFHSFATGPNIDSSFDSVDTPVSISAGDPAGTTSTLFVADDEVVVDVDVRVNIDHNATGELTLDLLTPVGSHIRLAKELGGTGNDFIETVFDDEANMPIVSGSPPFTGSFQPVQPLSDADGIVATGSWSLQVTNFEGSTSGTIDSWELLLTYPPQTCPPPADPPPPVPDGSGSTEPLLVARPAADQLLMEWDEQCSPVQTNLIYGPLDGVADYTVSGSLCGVTNALSWDPVPEGDLWFLLVSEDGFTTESSWGLSSSGERNGLDASDQCGNDAKEIAGTCP